MTIFSNRALWLALSLTAVSFMSLNPAWAGQKPLDEDTPKLKISATKSPQKKQDSGDSTNRSITSESMPIDPESPDNEGNNNNIIEKSDQVEGRLALFSNANMNSYSKRGIQKNVLFIVWPKLGWPEKVNLASVSKRDRAATDQCVKQGRIFGVKMLPDRIKSWTAYCFHRYYMDRFSHLAPSRLSDADKLKLEGFADIYEALGEKSMGVFIRIQIGKIEPTEDQLRLRRSDILNKRPFSLEHELGQHISREFGSNSDRLIQFCCPIVGRYMSVDDIVYLLIELTKQYKTPVMAASQFKRMSWGRGKYVLNQIWRSEDTGTALPSQFVAMRFVLCEPFLIKHAKPFDDIDLHRYKKWLRLFSEYLYNNDIEIPTGSGRFELIDDEGNDATALNLEFAAKAHVQLGMETYDTVKKQFFKKGFSPTRAVALKKVSVLKEMFFKKAGSLHNRWLKLLGGAATVRDIELVAEAHYQFGDIQKAISLYRRSGNKVAVKELSYFLKFTSPK